MEGTTWREKKNTAANTIENMKTVFFMVYLSASHPATGFDIMAANGKTGLLILCSFIY